VTDDRSTEVLAHGLGGSSDLPIPYTYALIGATWAPTFTFAVVELAWRRPRFDPARPGRPLPARLTAVVVAAHDRALHLLPKRHQVSGQLAMMLVMVGYTFTGLYLLFGG
jgi:hypothetical protein